jgi:hypothetical protein
VRETAAISASSNSPKSSCLASRLAAANHVRDQNQAILPVFEPETRITLNRALAAGQENIAPTPPGPKFVAEWRHAFRRPWY